MKKQGNIGGTVEIEKSIFLREAKKLGWNCESTCSQRHQTGMQIFNRGEFVKLSFSGNTIVDEFIINWLQNLKHDFHASIKGKIYVFTDINKLTMKIIDYDNNIELYGDCSDMNVYDAIMVYNHPFHDQIINIYEVFGEMFIVEIVWDVQRVIKLINRQNGHDDQWMNFGEQIHRTYNVLFSRDELWNYVGKIRSKDI